MEEGDGGTVGAMLNCSELHRSHLPLLCGSPVPSCVCWQSGLCLQAWLGQCVLGWYIFVMFFPGVAVQTEARVPGFPCQIPQLYYWAGEMLRGASEGKGRGSFLLQGPWLGSVSPSAWEGWCQGEGRYLECQLEEGMRVICSVS